MNAYQLYQAAFDSSCTEAEVTEDYLIGYADGAFNLGVSNEDAQKIINLIKAWFSHADEKKLLNSHSDHYYLLQKPLEEINLGHCQGDEDREAFLNADE